MPDVINAVTADLTVNFLEVWVNHFPTSCSLGLGLMILAVELIEAAASAVVCLPIGQTHHPRWKNRSILLFFLHVKTETRDERILIFLIHQFDNTPVLYSILQEKKYETKSFLNLENMILIWYYPILLYVILS